MTTYRLGSIPAVLALLLTACGSGSDSPGQQGQGTQVTVGVEFYETPLTVAGVSASVPSTWAVMGPQGMRLAQYAFGPIEGEADSATVAVYYFGPSSGGMVMDNIERWIAQMSPPDGGDPHDRAEHGAYTYGGMAVHTVEVAGTYRAPVAGPMSTETVTKETVSYTHLRAHET